MNAGEGKGLWLGGEGRVLLCTGEIALSLTGPVLLFCMSGCLVLQICMLGGAGATFQICMCAVSSLPGPKPG